MNIGFYVKWPKNSINSSGNVVGDELYGESMCRALSSMDGVTSAELFAPNYPPPSGLNVMVYLNDTRPMKETADKHVLYVQNSFADGSDKVLDGLYEYSYNGYAFISARLLEAHKNKGYNGIFLPFGVEPTLFKPMPKVEKYAFDVAYVGNDIKGKERTMLYIYPAMNYNFGLFGNWQIPISRKVMRWKNEHYQKVFYKTSRGKIPQEAIPYLYSSAKINLNCTAQDSVDCDVITLRTLEVLACKGFVISDRVPIAVKELSGCVAFTYGGNDLTEKIDYYLARPDERNAMALCGYDYVIKHATVQARAREFYNYIKGYVL